MIANLFIEIFGIEFTEANTAKIIVGGFFALLGLILNYLTKVRPVLDSDNKFNLRYFISQNWKDLLIVFILLFLAMRFTQEFIGVELTMWTAVVIGFLVDKLKDKFIGRIDKILKD
jgi:uncharacterized membrane protein